jgi:hypothetical protein
VVAFSGERHVGRADETELFLVRDHKDHAAVVVLQDVGLRAVVKLWHNNMTAFDQPHLRR